jgi:DnaJ-class molecular chaperone
MEIQAKDLYSKCAKCGGSGEYRESTSSRHQTYTTEGPCPDCEGYGIKLTEAGKVLSGFVSQLKQRRMI